MTHNDVIELQFQGWLAHKRGEPFDQTRNHHWRYGWMLRFKQQTQG